MNRTKMTDNSIGRTGKHSQFCEGHVSCPKTGKDECGKVMVSKCYLLKDGSAFEGAATVFCFGCGDLHNVSEG
jgi:hypothetical protein